MEDTEREKREKQQVYLVSLSREKGCVILNGALFASRHETTKYTHIEIEKGMYAWQGSKSSDVRQSPIKSETEDIWRQTIETIPKDSLYRSCSKDGRSLAKFPAKSPMGGDFVVKVAAG